MTSLDCDVSGMRNDDICRMFAECGFLGIAQEWVMKGRKDP